ncbi:hypothetical protein IEN85_13055 [Pelagicoccus sp. NFK12]|uniref:Beta-hexosaminidase bacterial type N-terminal domain-containing protein n=1 Tax=Pelagicoccus enzymogenes TaxID=2773457 RepID=A0A927F8H1_9BACT|nr:hypothetical protein [Pelagicoccus enzymogenes]MBD5780422.1 hypothetical protein [Pelagicoccus enzymogenes]
MPFGFVSTAASESLIEQHARSLLSEAGLSDKVEWVKDADFASTEGFRLEASGGGWRVHAAAPAGFLYGAQELTQPYSVIGVEGDPDFEIRGTVLMMLSQSWDYQSELHPDIFPWFFDRPLLTRYLDYMMSARLNTLVLWSGHLFPHILELPEYPEASRFTAEEIRRNQEQFRWLSTECAKRNITVLTHFYNIHISEDLAKSMGREGKEPTRYDVPDAFVAEYYRTLLSRYFETFPSVGLYVCPGESLALEHQQSWFENVIFKTARESGREPLLIIRDWTLDPAFMEALPTLYPNLYSELKHNDETITSPWPDERHRKWKGVLKGHIINLHDPADAVPYRTGSPKLFNEMVGHWKDEGYFKGSWFYPPQAWVWPNTVDSLGEGEALVAFERDELWHLLQGRYLWKAKRDAAKEAEWSADWLGRKFGNRQVGELLNEWYDLTAPILPGLQNLTAVRFGNFFPPSIARVQTDVDEIIGSRSSLEEGPIVGATGHTGQRYYSRPIDAYTIELYRKRYGLEEVADLRSLPVAQYAQQVVVGEVSRKNLLPLELVQLYVEMAQRSKEIAQRMAALPGIDGAERARFVSDSECLILTARYYQLKIQAAFAKRMLIVSGEDRYADDLKEKMEESVRVYERLVSYARLHYVAGSSMWDAKPWERTLEDKVKWDRDEQMKWLEAHKNSK